MDRELGGWPQDRLIMTYLENVWQGQGRSVLNTMINTVTVLTRLHTSTQHSTTLLDSTSDVTTLQQMVVGNCA